MQPHSAYIRYRASSELDAMVARYIESMEQANPQPDLALLLAVMEKFVNESVDTFVLKPAAHIGLKSAYLKMIHSLSSLVEKSAMMLVHKVAKKMSVEDHCNAAQYMKQVRLVELENGEPIGDIIFPIHVEFAELGWSTRDRMLKGNPKEPVVLADGIQFLHAVIDVANLWVFEKPMEILKLGPFMRSLAITTVGAVKKATHSLIDTLVPKISEHQVRASAEYFSDIVGPGPYDEEYGLIPEPILQLRAGKRTSGLQPA